MAPKQKLHRTEVGKGSLLFFFFFLVCLNCILSSEKKPDYTVDIYSLVSKQKEKKFRHF